MERTYFSVALSKCKSTSNTQLRKSSSWHCVNTVTNVESAHKYWNEKGKTKWEALVSAVFCTYLNPKWLVVFQGMCCGFVCVCESRGWPFLPVREHRITLDQTTGQFGELRPILCCSSTTDLLTPWENCLAEQQVSLQSIDQINSIEDVIKWEEE